MTKIRLEAEALTLQNYVRESLDFASSGVSAKLPKGSGTITTTLGPDFSAGLYNIVVTYFDENDGRSQMEMRVGGQLVDSWVLDKDPNVAAGYVTVQRTVATGQRLAAGTTIELKGTQNKGEFARVDYIELERVGNAPTPSNTAPSAVNDSVTTTAQQPVTINVLSNDSDVDGDTLTVTNFTNLTAVGGSVSLDSDKTLTYIPSANFSGSDSFSYSISDGKGGTDTATVAVQVNAATPTPPLPTGGGAKIRLEAESLTLKNYVRENLDFASAGTSVKLPSGSGSITTTLGQNFSAGLYNIVVTYFDENDGRSQMEMRVGGQLVDSWVLDKDPNVAAGYVTVQRTVATGQRLAAGTTIELKGTQNKGEFARVDYIELERVGDAPPPSNTAPSAMNDSATTTAQQPVTINVLSNDSDADGDLLMITEFASSTAAGGSVGLNSDKTLTYTPSASFSGSDSFSYSISDGKGGTDTATVAVQVNAATPPSPPPSSGGAKIRLEAESLTLKNYVRENLDFASAGTSVKLPSGSGSITTTLGQNFSAGLYNIVVTYFDENDGRSQMEMRVGGQLVDSWVLDKDPNVAAGYVTVQRTVATGQRLAAGTTIELKGTQNKGEFARVDYIELERVGDAPPPSPTPKSGGVILNLQTNVALSPLFGAMDTPRLLPLGDSITAGVHRESSMPGGYRIQFWDRSVADGLAIDFVGSENSKSGSLLDGDNAGFPGRKIDQTTAWVNDGNLSRYPADAILLMIGTNDANNGFSGTSMRNRLSTLIDTISSKAPNTHLFVSSIPPFDAPKGTASEAKNADIYNALLPDLVAQKATQGKRVSYVNAGGSLSVGDMNGDNSLTTDSDDGIHPSSEGYNKLGDAWYDLVFNPKPLTGSNLKGTQFTDRLIGNSSSNVLKGNGGQDHLTGGGGSDIFDYKEPTEGTDKITDFGSDDLFRISSAGFGGGLVSNMQLDSSSFIVGSNPVAITSKATFLYDTTNNTLSFDQDGTGNAGALGIATLTNGYRLQSSQIDIVA